MIEIRKINDSSIGMHQYNLFIDGSLVEGALLTNFGFADLLEEDDSRVSYDLISKTDQATDRLSRHPLFEFLGKKITKIRLKYSSDWLEVLNQLWIQPNDETETYSIQFMLNKVSRWQREYSFADYFEQLGRLIKESKDQNIKLTTDDTEDSLDEYIKSILPMEVFGIVFTSCQSELPLADEIIRCSNVIRGFHEQVEEALDSRVHSNSVVMSFDFPEEVRVPCEQYLLYFVQFLKDLGVEATAELQHEAGQVLFAVTPTDKQTALDKIRTALETYLQLTANPVNDASTVDYEIAAQRLAANIDHLKGQLRLAHAELRLAEATAQTQQVTINNLLDSQFFIESMKNVTPKPEEDKEELLDGTVALTKFNWKGVEFNLPEIFRRLRQMFSEDK